MQVPVDTFNNKPCYNFASGRVGKNALLGACFDNRLKIEALLVVFGGKDECIDRMTQKSHAMQKDTVNLNAYSRVYVKYIFHISQYLKNIDIGYPQPTCTIR